MTAVAINLTKLFWIKLKTARHCQSHHTEKNIMDILANSIKCHSENEFTKGMEDSGHSQRYWPQQ